MGSYNQQTLIDISGTVFPRFKASEGGCPQRFWYIKDEFLKHSKEILQEGESFSFVQAHLTNGQWKCVHQPIKEQDRAYFINKLRLFYLKSENMSIYSFCTYMENYIKNEKVQNFFKYMRVNWEERLSKKCSLPGAGYRGNIKTNKQLIDTLLYSGSFHSQEKYARRLDELLLYMDESLIIKNTYNALYNGFQMTQISRAIKDLREDNLVIMLPNHLRHEWDKNYPLSHL